MTLSWQAPAGPAARGTVVVLPGRGEHGGVYERFGRRLASDAYGVYALDDAVDADAVRELAAGAAAPLVLAGSDVGALRVLELVARGAVAADGIVLAALPDPDQSTATGGWDWELAARTTCPTHRARLSGDEAFVRGSLGAPVPAGLGAALEGAALERIDVPALILHGGADPVAPVAHALRVAERLRRSELAVVATAPHDVLNDSTHRTVAAQVVQWLERLRAGPELAPIIRVLSAEPAAARY